MLGITRSLRDAENQRVVISNFVGPSATPSVGRRFGCSGESDRGAWSELSESSVPRLLRSVVAIASFDGDTTMLVERTGLCIHTSCACATSFLTPASLVPRTQHMIGNVTIKVRLLNDEIVTGWLEDYDAHFYYAVVNIKHVDGFHAVDLNHSIQFEPYRKVVALWRHFNSGLLMATSGVELGPPVVEPEQIMLSTCRINSPGIGGPLVDLGGNFVGMNSYPSGQEMTPFIQRVLILKLLVNCGIIRRGIERRIDGTIVGSTSEIQKSSTPSNSSTRVGTRAINSFEDVFDDDIWTELPKGVASRLFRSVVSLASFNGDATVFSCTGFVIKCNQSSARIITSASLIRTSDDAHSIITNLRIEVCLQPEFRVIGMLKMYNLQYNLACVDIIGYWNLLPLETRLNPAPITNQMDVIAVGCLFDQFKIMVTRGTVLLRESKLDCKSLGVSTCKTSKAGIGGPLIDTRGNLVGMNFYHHEETPFLPYDVIDNVSWHMDPTWFHFYISPKEADTIQCDGNPPPQEKINRWPLPKPKPWYFHWPKHRENRPKRVNKSRLIKANAVAV